MLESDTIVPVVLFVSIAMTLLGIVSTLSDGRTRRKLIDAGHAGEIARAMGDGAGAEERFAGALKWGIVAIAAGVALVTIQFLPYDRDEPIVLGILLLFVGAGMLVYYRLGRTPKRGGG